MIGFGSRVRHYKTDRHGTVHSREFDPMIRDWYYQVQWDGSHCTDREFRLVLRELPAPAEVAA